MIQTASKHYRPSNVPFYIRFFTLTIKSGPDLQLRAETLLEAWRRFQARMWWGSRTRGAIIKIEVTWDPDLGWHVHLHGLQVGSYLPQEELSEEWREATRGEGHIVDVRGLRLEKPEDALEVAKELAKYVTKPMASVGGDEVLEGGKKALPIQEWPLRARSDLASLLMGGTRTRYYCPVHRSTSWRRCRDLLEDPGPGLRALPCEGGFRIEITGFKRLRFYGVLRAYHKESRDYREELESRCRSCGVGKLRTKATLEAWARGLQDDTLLNLIQGHNSTDAWVSPFSRGPRYGLKSGPEGSLDPFLRDRPPPEEVLVNV